MGLCIETFGSPGNVVHSTQGVHVQDDQVGWAEEQGGECAENYVDRVRALFVEQGHRGWDSVQEYDP